MRILHYSLGLPPYRSGGLTKYANDLMLKQNEKGDEVFLLFPGEINKNRKYIDIKKYKRYKGIDVYELKNPLPVPLRSGIREPNIFMEKCDEKKYFEFFKSLKLDIFHVHTFMGLHIEALQACRKLGVKIVYTTHDYFGLCAKVNFLNCENRVCDSIIPDKCVVCNNNSVSLNKIIFLQSRLYRFIKDSGIINKLYFIKKINNRKKNQSLYEKKIDKVNFIDLMLYYKKMFNMIDKFLFNSNVTKAIYNKYLDVPGKVISITHNNILDNRVLKKYDDKVLKVTYLGPQEQYKGFFLLTNVMKKFKSMKKEDIQLSVYGDNKYRNNQFNANINFYGRYNYNTLEKIFSNTDVLVVPSIWYETFGFIVIEALSYGIPVIASKKVGAKDILVDGEIKYGIVVEDNEEELYGVLEDIRVNRDILKKINFNIVNSRFSLSLDDHYYKIKNEYKN